jgi:2-methylisocitrate lyase-like PEP mutase family enzyme
MNNYEKFYQLHHQQEPLLIANAWNAKSAQLIEKAGFDAIATSSGAIADSLGYKDGENIPFAELLYVIGRIKAVTTIPLSVDMESGYTKDLTVLNEQIQQLIDAGAVGINLEDNQGEELYLSKLSSVKNYLLKTNQQLFINARTDGFLQKIENPLENTIRRIKLYENAGADGIFVTGVQDEEIIKAIVASTSLPVNVVGVSKLASVNLLSGWGIKRISMAGILYSTAYKNLEGILTTVKAENSLSVLYK